jgi:hypothetical protein
MIAESARTPVADRVGPGTAERRVAAQFSDPSLHRLPAYTSDLRDYLTPVVTCLYVAELSIRTIKRLLLESGVRLAGDETDDELLEAWRNVVLRSPATTQQR